MKPPRGLTDDAFLAELLDLRACGLDAATALRCVAAMDHIARLLLDERQAAGGHVYYHAKTA